MINKSSALPTEYSSTGSYDLVLPLPLSVLLEELELFSAQDESALSIMADMRVAVHDVDHPLRQILSYQGRRPERLRQKNAYKIGALVMYGTIVRQEQRVLGDSDKSMSLSAGLIVRRFIRNVASSDERFPVSQFTNEGEDVRKYFHEIAEVPWLSKHVSFLHGHEHDPGHNPWVVVGAGDIAAAYALSAEGWKFEDLKTEPLA